MDPKTVTTLLYSFFLILSQTGTTSLPLPLFFGAISFPVPQPQPSQNLTINDTPEAPNVQICKVVKGCVAIAPATPSPLECVPIGSMTVCDPAMATTDCLWPPNQRDCIVQDLSTPLCACRNLDN
ncbi:unnamed protein product [Orchesella dallaii]|uniref:Uncharacterized protein n=1 Tax=Orchesella dallaii TaxID=48710 RepID=A0ABP1QM64_9HEXA